jgi:four helix bundle protein
MHNYKNLKIWQKSMDLTNQIRRAPSSIPSNIAEGAGRQSKKEFKYFLSKSLGSCYEVSTQLELAKRLSLITKEKSDPILHEIDQVEKMIIGFMKSLRE